MWNGYEVRFEGDSYFVVFNNLTDAIMFSVQTQKDLMHAPWADELLQHPKYLF